jgi:putative ABC transport system substrate-binding protein
MSPQISQTLPTLGAADDAQSSRGEAKGLMSYGPNVSMSTRLCVGRNQAILPVEQPTKFNFVLNLANAKALGIEVPPTRLARADEVIE